MDGKPTGRSPVTIVVSAALLLALAARGIVLSKKQA